MTRMSWSRILLVASAIAMAPAASAHPGHGAEGGSFSVAHYVTDPAHVFGVLVPLAAVVAAGWLWRRRRARTL